MEKTKDDKSDKSGKPDKSDKADKAKPKIKVVKKVTAVDELTTEEREAVTVVFHQFETGLRTGTIYTKVSFEVIFAINTIDW